MELRGNKTNAAKYAELLKKLDVNLVSVSVLGNFVHLSTYEKYKSVIHQVMHGAGFELLCDSNEYHLDGWTGYRMSYRLK